jgi:Rieske Fe-S protein
MGEENNVDRRNFMKIATLGIGGFIGAVLAIPSIAYIISPAQKSKVIEDWIRLGSVSKVETGTPTLFKVKIEDKTGWIVNEQELSVYVLTENGRDYIALSNICTHLGCRVRWIDEASQFYCPCHNGIFDKEGKVVSGPPPRPLDRYEVKTVDNQLFIKGS